jgi:hypothetical protein
MKPYDLLACMWIMLPPSFRSVYQKVTGNKSFASLVLPDRLQDAEIKAGIAKGMKMRLNLQRERSFFLGMHEEDVQRCLLKQVKQGMTVYNVGAHIGFFTLGLGHRV